MVPHATEEGRPERYYKRRAIPKRAEGVAKVVVREQRPVRMSAAKAEALVPADLLLKKLGKSSFRLWAALLTMRNEECESHPSTGGLMEATGLSGRNLARCFVRLRRFKLVEDFGFMYLRVPCRCIDRDSCPGHKVYVRNVYGLLKASVDNQTQIVLVPRETGKLINDADAHGGKRKGAGRPKGVRDGELCGEAGKARKESSMSPYKYQEPISLEEPNGSSEKCGASLRVESGKTVVTTTSPKAKVSSISTSIKSSPTLKEPSMPPPLQPQAQPAAPSLAQLEGPTAPNGAVAVVVDGKSCDLLDALMAEGAQSFSLGGSRTGPVQRYTTEDLRAATELSNQIETLKAPAPPQLQPSHTETQRLHLLKAAFRAVHEKVMGTDYWRPRKELTAKERQALMAACEALMVEGINPTAWARFSFHQWGRMGQKSAPTPKWVWTASRISEHAGWCHDATGSLNTGAVVPVPASRELMLRLSVLRQKLGWGRPTDVVVSEVLPKDERRALLIKQANQLEAGRRELEQQINNGEWVWG